MTKGKTTSMRFSPQLAARLEKAAQHLHKGKNTIVAEALETYLNCIDQQEIEEQLISECQQLAREERLDIEKWEEAADVEDWKWEDD